jgi:hypothetical protein
MLDVPTRQSEIKDKRIKRVGYVTAAKQITLTANRRNTPLGGKRAEQ